MAAAGLRVRIGDESLAYGDAVRRGIIDEKSRTVLIDGKRVPFSVAAQDGILVHEPVLPTLAELARDGRYNPDTGMVVHPLTGQQLSLREAIEDGGIVDRRSINLRDPGTGRLISLTEAFERGLLDADTGDLVTRRYLGGTVAAARGNGNGIEAGAPIADEMAIVDDEATAEDPDTEILSVRCGRRIAQQIVEHME